MNEYAMRPSELKQMGKTNILKDHREARLFENARSPFEDPSLVIVTG